MRSPGQAGRAGQARGKAPLIRKDKNGGMLKYGVMEE